MKVKNSKNVLIETVIAIGDLKIEIWTSDFQHALQGHPEVTIEKVREAVIKPAQVIQSRKNNLVCLFYSSGLMSKEFGTIYFCVVVRILLKGSGKLETAYETNYIKSGINLLCSKKRGVK